MDQVMDTPIELIDRHFEANVIAPIILTKLVLPQMVDRGAGVIINLASASGTMDPPSPAGQGGWGLGYGASKAALASAGWHPGRRAEGPWHPGLQPQPRIHRHRTDRPRHGRVRVRRVEGCSGRRRWRGRCVAGHLSRRREPKWAMGRGAAPLSRARACFPAGPEGPFRAPSGGGTASGSERAGAARRYSRLPMAEPASTRDLLLDAAARLFAERGVDNVSIAEIVRAADQRNTSAVHYHFGSRDEVLRAVLARHVPELAERRSTLLEHARARPARDARSAAEAIVRPVTEFAQGGWRQRAYLQIGSELAGAVDRITPGVRDLLKLHGRSRGLGTPAATLSRRSRRTSGSPVRRSASCSSAGPPPTGPANSTRAVGVACSPMIASLTTWSKCCWAQ